MWSSGIGHSVTILPEATYEKNRYPSHVFWSRVSCLTSHVSRLTPCLTNSPAPASPEDSKRLRLFPKFTATTVANMVQFPQRKFPVDGRGLVPTFAAEPTAMRIPTQSNNSCEVLRAYPTGAERIVKVTPLPCGLTPLYLGYCHLNVLEGSVK